MLKLDCNNGIMINLNNGYIALDKDWQYPAKTEWAVFESIRGSHISKNDTLYIAFPWATLFDGLKMGLEKIRDLVIALNNIGKMIKVLKYRRIYTVCQHIYMKKFAHYFKVAGITDIFWSHKIFGENSLEGMNIHPFALYPAQTEDLYRKFMHSSDQQRQERILNKKFNYTLNFIGAYNPKIYLSNIREIIFKDKEIEDFLIIERNDWHFNRIVYDAQMQGKKLDTDKALQESSFREEYISIIDKSEFTLCPTGSGPNSIRIYESLCLGSIPVILTKSLHLPGDAKLWENACIIVDDSEIGYLTAKHMIRNMSQEERQYKRLSTISLLDSVGVSNYTNIVFGLCS